MRSSDISTASDARMGKTEYAGEVLRGYKGAGAVPNGEIIYLSMYGNCKWSNVEYRDRLWLNFLKGRTKNRSIR